MASPAENPVAASFLPKFYLPDEIKIKFVLVA
jgi:hypothetical protein